MASITQVVSLAEVRTHLRYPVSNTADDDTIQNIFIPAATDVIRMECGDIVPTIYDETYDGGNFEIWLRHRPVLEINNIEEGWGFTTYTLDYVQVNSLNATSMFAYSIDDAETGQITRRSAGNVNIRFMHGNQNIRVTYAAGRESVPAAVKLAALELIAHWWQNSQQRGSGQAFAYDNTAEDFTRSTGISGYNAGVPYRILELLKPYRRMPFIG